MTSFLDFCRLHGIVIDALPPIGAWRRYKTEDKPRHRNGAVKFMGDHGFCQNHATMVAVATWRGDERSSAVAQRSDAEIQEQRTAQKQARQQAIRSARSFWQRSSPLSRLHPYLERKGLSPQGCSGLRVNDGQLVVPVHWGDRITSIQTIGLDGTKRFWPGAPVKGGAHVIARPHAAVTVLCEGLATGLAVYQCVRQASVIVAFDCGNLLHVADRLRPQGSVVIAADNDHKTAERIGANPGFLKAQAVAQVHGYGVAHPQGLEGSDWADALVEWGQGAERRIERLILAQARLVMT